MSHKRKFSFLIAIIVNEIKNFLLMEFSTEEYRNPQIISKGSTEAFYSCFNRKYKLSTLNIFMRILAPASPNLIECRTMRVWHCSLRCLNISDNVLADIGMHSVISYNKHNE